jgi:hypothetical protein
MPGHNRFRLDDEQRRTPMAPEAVKRDPEETIGGRESGALMKRAFEGSDLMAQSQDLELEVKARTKDRTECDDQCDEKYEQGSGHRRGEYSERSCRCATFSTASSLLCRSAHKPRPDGQFHRVAGSPGPFAVTPATASPASLRPVFQSGAWSDATAPNRGADRRS